MERLKKRRLSIPEGESDEDGGGFEEEKDDLPSQGIEVKRGAEGDEPISSPVFPLPLPLPPSTSSSDSNQHQNQNNNQSLINPHSPPPCSSCHQYKELHSKLFKIYHENICYDCYDNSSQPEIYQQITQQELKEKYLITSTQIHSSFPYYELKKNPCHRSFHCMKLFLVKHVKEYLVKKYVTMERFERIKEEKDEKKAQKEIEKYQQRLKNGEIGVGGEGEGGKGKGESLKSQKKRKTDLMIKSLVSIIKGDDKSNTDSNEQEEGHQELRGSRARGRK